MHRSFNNYLYAIRTHIGISRKFLDFNGNHENVIIFNFSSHIFDACQAFSKSSRTMKLKEYEYNHSQHALSCSNSDVFMKTH